MDLLEVNTFKLMDCNKAHYDKEVIQVNERRYVFGDGENAKDEPDDWVCAKIPNDGRIKKDCVSKREAPGWYVGLLENRDYKGCNGGVCFCDDRDACNSASKIHSSFQMSILVFSAVIRLLYTYRIIQ